MEVKDFKIGDVFVCNKNGDTRWKVTDIGTRTVIAIKVVSGWMAGPPYAQAEMVFDEDDLPVCEKVE